MKKAFQSFREKIINLHYKLGNKYDDDFVEILWDWGFILGLLIIVPHSMTATLCIGPSMLPTIHDKLLFNYLIFLHFLIYLIHNIRGELVVVDKFTHYWFKAPYQRGDIIISRSPNNRKRSICKRIVAIEGDIVQLVKCKHARDTNNPNTLLYEVVMQQIAPGEVYLAGDNPSNSLDSRMYGSVPLSFIRGSVMAKVWDNVSIFPRWLRGGDFIRLPAASKYHSSSPLVIQLFDHAFCKQHSQIF
jgi:inner membrane protease subunit 1